MKKYTFKPLLSAVLAATLLLSLSACGSGANGNQGGKDGTPAKGTPWHYLISAGDVDIVVDQDGNEVMRGSNLHFLSGNGYSSAPVYIVSNRYVSTGVDEYGYPVGATYATLYDMNGTLVAEEQQQTYRPAFGKYVISLNIDYMDVYMGGGDTFSNLIDPLTGTVLYEDISYIDFLDDEYIALYGLNGSVADVVDRNGQHAENFPTDFGYSQIVKYGAYYIASYITSIGAADDYSSMVWNYVLLDENFSTISKVYTYIGHSASTYYLCSTEGNSMVSVIDAATGGAVFETEDLYYYDSDIYITKTYEMDAVYILYTADDTPLLTFDSSFSPQYDDDGVLAHIYYVDPETSNAVCVDRAGNETARNTEFVANSITLITDDRILIDTKVPSSDDAFFSNYNYYLFNSALRPVGNNPNIYDGYMYHPTVTANYLIASRRNTQGAYATLYDIVDLNGNLKLQNIKLISDSTDDRLVVEWGFSVGLIDLNGNWVYKTSAFNSAVGDETDTWWY